jgi:hypothetical protein
LRRCSLRFRRILAGVALVVTASLLVRRRQSPSYDSSVGVPSMTWSPAALRGTVTRLAAEPDAQLAYLKHIMRGIDAWPSLDELALEFDDEYERVRPDSGPEAETLSPAAVEALALLDARLDAMSGEANAHLWEPAALNGPEWTEVRRLAKSTLDALTIEGQDPPADA